MSKKSAGWLTTIIGIIILVGGNLIVKKLNLPEGVLDALPYICIGIGCGLFGHGMGNLITEKTYKDNPDARVQMEIELNDERNIMITNKAKAKAYDLMIFVFGAMLIGLALMNIDMAVILLLVFAYLFVIGYAIYYRCKYEKQM